MQIRRRASILSASLIVVASSVGLWCASHRSAQPEPPPSVVRGLEPAERAELERTWGPELSRSNDVPWFSWWEAEDSIAGNFGDNPFAPKTPEEASVLSGGRWVGTSGAQETPFLEYSVEVPEAGTYQLYARKFWYHGPFRWRFGDAAWTNADKVELLDQATIRLHVEANWVHLGEVSLPRGPQKFRLELLNAKDGAAFDAFLLSSGELVPRGKLKPSDSHPAAPEGWVTFAPGIDDFSPAELDLRSQNQDRTGSEGFIRASGSELVFEQTQRRVRFWGVNAGAELLGLTEPRMARYARRLAKVGVNLVRFHTPLFSDDDIRKLDPDKVAALHRLIPALREQGIYLALSSYFPLWWYPKPEHGFQGYTGQRAFSLPYFDPKFEALQREWFRTLLASPNPHTGVPLAQDPTLALVELVNEDSTLFWTFDPYKTIPEAQTIEFERAFGGWLAQKYGGLSQAFSVWGGGRQRGDEIAQGRAGFVPLHAMSESGDRRAQDTAEFLARRMRDYYQRMHTFLKGDLGVQALSICSNWITAQPHVLGPLDDWANAVCDVMDRHAYVSGPHEGDDAGHSVRAGQTYDDDSALRASEHKKSFLPFVEPRINDKPTVVSELGWPWPNRFRGEGPLLTAAYGRLHGIDGVMFFGTSRPGWADALGKFEISEPATLGQFPAASSIFRRGLVREAQPIATVARSEQALFSLKGIPITTEPALDTLRASDQPLVAQKLGIDRDGDALAFLVGPIAIELGTPGDRFEATDIGSWIDSSRHLVRSRTDELSWQHSTGLVQIRAPEVEAAIGFVGTAGAVELPTLRFSLLLDYATLALVSLDGRPVAESQHLLLQVFSEAKNSNWSAPGAGTRSISSAGGPPILTRSIGGVVEWLGKPDTGVRVTALDAHGRALRKTVTPTRRTPLLPGVFHYLLER